MSRPQNVELKNVLKLGCSIFYGANIRSERSLKPSQLNRRRQHTLKFTTLTATETPASAHPWGQLRRQLIANIYIFKYLRILSNLLSIFFRSVSLQLRCAWTTLREGALLVGYELIWATCVLCDRTAASEIVCGEYTVG